MNVTSSTPDRCLNYHGKIIKDLDQVPEIEGCSFKLLNFPVGQLDDYGEKRNRMKEIVEDELRRRELFRTGRRALKQGNCQKAIDKFTESVKYDEYLRELEEIVKRDEIKRCEQRRSELRKIFIHGYKEKFGLKRYERYPEKMREDRKEAGLSRIKDLFEKS